MLKVFHLKFTAPLHISNVREDYAQSNRRIHSDTLYSAIIQVWAWLGKSANLAGFVENSRSPNFTLSSLFPYTQSITTNNSSKTVYFLPRPLKSFDLTPTVIHEFKGKMKLLKEIEWLDVATYTEQIQQAKGYTPKRQEVQQIYLSKDTINTNFLDSQIIPHVSIPRDGGDANPFYVEQLRFASNSGLYGIFEGSETDFADFKVAMNLLQDEGIGTDKSMGYGRFEFSIADETTTQQFKTLFQQTETHTYYTNLSLYNPESYSSLLEMLPQNDPNVGFEWIKRGGWITSFPYMTKRKKSIYMFAEGSIFKSNTPLTEHGFCRDVKPAIISANEHPIWRVGKSLFVPILFPSPSSKNL